LGDIEPSRKGPPSAKGHPSFVSAVLVLVNSVPNTRHGTIRVAMNVSDACRLYSRNLGFIVVVLLEVLEVHFQIVNPRLRIVDHLELGVVLVASLERSVTLLVSLREFLVDLLV